MSTSVSAPQQHKQPSRKGKKAWRKNVDLTEVQEGLRQLKDEEIKGYFLIRYNPLGGLGFKWLTFCSQWQWLVI